MRRPQLYANMQQGCISCQFRLWFIILILCTVQSKADILVFSAMARHQIKEEFRDIPARFGGAIPSEGIKGMVVYADPPKACHKIKGPPNDVSYNTNWIVLIARLNCTFEMKVRMAQQAGYSAAIVHNVDSDELEPMSAKDPVDINIPSVFVSESTGLIIKENYLYDKLYFVLINSDLPFNANTHLLLPFAIVVGICFLVMVIFMVVRCIKDRRRQRRHRLPSSSLKKIPTHKYSKGDPYETCAICLDDYLEGEKLRVLPCAHAYHAKCIDPWLTKNKRVCPFCKRKVFAADEQVVTDESDSDADDATPLIRDGHRGTQGGTFAHSRQNPFRRMRRNPPAQETNHPTTSSDSEQSSIVSDSGDAMSIGEASNGTAFMVSDSHSINGEPPELERSVSSTKPNTVNLYTDTQQFPAPVVQVTSSRNTRPVMTTLVVNSDCSSSNSATSTVAENAANSANSDIVI